MERAGGGIFPRGQVIILETKKRNKKKYIYI